MKKITALLIVLIVGTSTIKSQPQDSIIQDIRAKYEETRNNLNGFEKINIDILDESAEGGQGTAYYDKNDLKLIKVVWYGETGKRIMAYYFDKGDLYFASDQNFRYNAPMYLDKETALENGESNYYDPDKTQVVEERYYFTDGELFLWLDNERTEVDLTLESNSHVGEDLIEHANKMKGKMKN